MFENKNILVTGGAGFIGSHLCDEILKYDAGNVIVLDNLSLGNIDNLKDASQDPRLQIIVGDACDYAVVKDIILTHEVDIVFNLAVVPLPASLGDPHSNVKINVDIVNNLCELQRLKRFETLVHFSSSEAYGSAQFVPMTEKHPYTISTPYAASKASGDLIALSYSKTFGLDTLVVRPFNNYGPRQNQKEFAGIIPLVVEKLLKNEPIEIHGKGTQTRDYIYVKDTARIVLELFKTRSRHCGPINIATGIETTTLQIVEQLAELMPLAHSEITHIEDRLSNVSRHCGDINLLREICGLAPQTSLSQGLKETVRWYKNES